MLPQWPGHHNIKNFLPNQNHRQNYGQNSQGQDYGLKLQGQNFGPNYQGQSSGQNFEGQNSGQNFKGQTYGQNFKGQAYGQNFQSQTYGQNFKGQTYGQNFQSQNYGQNFRGQNYAQNSQGLNFRGQNYDQRRGQEMHFSPRFPTAYSLQAFPQPPTLRVFSVSSTQASSVLPAKKVLTPFSNSDTIRKKLVQLKAKLSESPLPREFDSVVTRLSCSLCGVTSPEPKYMKPHWVSVLHKDEVRHWLEEWFRKMRSSKNIYKKNRPRAYEYEEDKDFCYVCMAPFSNPNMAASHYDSKPHEKRIINILFELAISKYHNTSQFKCDICNVISHTKEQLNNHLESPNHAKKLRALGVAVEVPVFLPKGDNEMKFECSICNIKTNTEEMLRIHMTSSRHLKKLKKMSGEGIIEAQGISGPSNVFSYECRICNVKADSYEQLEIHLSSKKHKRSVEKRSDPVKNEIIERVLESRKKSEYKCDTCNVITNAYGQYKMHMWSSKHQRAVARHQAEQQNNENTKDVASKKRARMESESDDYETGKRKPSESVKRFLNRYQFLVENVPECNDYEEASNIQGPCGRMLVLRVPGEYLWHTLQRNSNIWSKNLSCASTVVLGDEADLWRVTASFDNVKGIAESPEMMTSRIAAGELLLHKLQKIYYSITMPKDVFAKLECYENVNYDDEEEEEEEEEQEGGEKEEEKEKEGEKTGVKDAFELFSSNEEVLCEDNVDEEEEEEEEINSANIYLVDKKNGSNMEFEEMVNFYLQDYQVNVEDFRDLVFINFHSHERLTITEISAVFGIVAEYRRSKKGIVVMVSKIKTLYKNDVWTFAKVMLLYKNKHFQKWDLVKPGNNELCKYSSVKYIDDEEKKDN